MLMELRVIVVLLLYQEIQEYGCKLLEKVNDDNVYPHATCTSSHVLVYSTECAVQPVHVGFEFGDLASQISGLFTGLC